MAKVSTEAVSDFVEESILDNGKYRFQIYDAKVLEPEDGYNSLQLNLVCTDGPEQKDGSDPIDRKIVDFHPLEGYENHKDGGKFAKSRYVSLLKAVGIDYASGEEWDTDDLVDEEVLLVIRRGKDLDGEPREMVAKYLPMPE